MSQWIWKFGEFEIYHNQLVHNRRVQYGYREAPVWKVYSPDSVVRFRKTVTTNGGEFHIWACGYYSVVVGTGVNEKKYRGKAVIPLEAGTTMVQITVSSPEEFPCLYIDGVIETDGSWTADDLTAESAPVGTYPCFDAPDKLPTIFPFRYEPVACICKEAVLNGTLFDFGRETFARTVFTVKEDRELMISLGESWEEALDTERSVIHYRLRTENRRLELPPSAFRYIYVEGDADVTAEYEYLPLEYRGGFHCGEDIVNRVWDTAAYTFHLNCREFFLDGIKRDRWVWSADAYQSLFVNRCLFLDQDIEKRTLIALGGKSPIRAHINTIMDYTFFWIISLHEYYITYGDRRFLEQIYPQARDYMRFCRERADKDGFARGREGDWIFIDWAPMDKDGALCGEQILFAKAMECFAAICAVIGRNDEGCGEQAKTLQTMVIEKFYDKEKGVFIDSFESGKRNVTRHSNILAYLFLPLNEEVKASLYEQVVLNDDVRHITTPYFKFYENQVHCESGNNKLLEHSIRKYYGSMLDTGATTLYEEYDPAMKGAEHYAMYGGAYEKSLCHAWSASPIYLLGRYRLGVRNTGVGYDTFEIAPNPGDLGDFTGTVPLPKGSVSITVENGEAAVQCTVEGGTLVAGGKRIPVPAGHEVRAKL